MSSLCLCNGLSNCAFLCKINGFRAVKCYRCGLVYLNPQPNQEELKEYYIGYHNGIGGRSIGDDQRFLSSVGEQKLFQHILGLTSKLCPRGSLLDVGCSYGHLIKSALKAGYDAYGIEPTEEPFNYARRLFGQRVYQSPLKECNFDEASFDIVTMINVLEHLPSPKNIVTDVYRILRPGGLFVVVVPNLLFCWPIVLWSAYITREHRLVSTLALFDTPFHLYFFTPCSLQRLLESSGFKIILKNNAPVIKNKSVVRTSIKEIYKIISDIVSIVTWNRLLLGHSIIMLGVKSRGSDTSS